MTIKVKHLIIGAGPAGLGAAYRLNELGAKDFLIVERNPYVGGLATSFVDDQGFTWDIGGHVQFSHYKYFDDLMDRALGLDGWLQHERESWVWMKDRFVPYPFQNNIRYLPKESVWRCLKGVIDATVKAASASAPEKPKDFHQWILAVFGDGIAEEFMLPYNFKVWAFPPAEMAYQWIGERVSVVDLKRVTENVVLERDDLSWGPNNLFRFPKRGGTGAIWENVAKLIGLDKIRLNTTVTKIEAGAKRVTLADGEIVHYEQLLSTLPLDHLIALVAESSAEMRSFIPLFRYSSSNIIGIGLAGQPKTDLATKCWMYFPEDNCPFYRVTLFSKYSPYNVPDITKQFSLMTETSESSAKPVNHAELVEATILGLLNTKLIQSRDQVVSTWSYRAQYGYPTPFLLRDRILSKVIPELDALGIYSRGRFGGWKYEVSNQDHTCMQGVEWVNRIQLGKAETTFTV